MTVTTLSQADRDLADAVAGSLRSRERAVPRVLAQIIVEAALATIRRWEAGEELGMGPFIGAHRAMRDACPDLGADTYSAAYRAVARALPVPPRRSAS